MRKSVLLLTAAACFVVAGCSGGGGGAGVTPISTPTPAPPPPPPPPPPSNTSLTDLQYSQTFASDGATSNATFDLTAKTTTKGTAALATVTVSYDAAAKSYTIVGPAGSQTFGPSDIQASSDANETDYQTQQGGNHDYLTLVKLPFTSSVPLQYVNLGFWQRNEVTGTTQNTSFDIFAYGLATPASAVPRVGVGTYGIDAFGFFITPGLSPKGIEGHGTFTADFLSGGYSTDTTLYEYDLTDLNKVTIGALTLDSDGKLSASDGTFSGNMIYRGNDGSVAGTLTGRFYGPHAEELGGTFAADNGQGSALTGAFTGSQDPNGTPVNITLTNLVTEQSFGSNGEALEVDRIPGQTAIDQARRDQIGGDIDIALDGTIKFIPGRSDLPSVTFTAADKVASPANYTTYSKVVNGQTVELSLYTPGPANTQLALTYSGFANWRVSGPDGGETRDIEGFSVYGLGTPQGLLSRRTGTAHYDGILIGAGANQTSNTLYDLSGTSKFDVDFSAQDFTGSLAIMGTDRANGSKTDFGSFDFKGVMGYTAETQSLLMQGGTNTGTITTNFFGPNGEEIGGSFEAGSVRPDGSVTHLVGATIAKTH